MGNGCLILGGMPIGNPQDISLRMIHAIKTCDVVVAENKQFFIDFCYSLNLKHTEEIIQLQYDDTFEDTKNKTFNYLKNNKTVLLVSDCGMPTITDPGREIVEEAIKNQILTTVLPGPNVAITGLSLSTFDTNNFNYYGYLPKDLEQKKSLLKSASVADRTLVFLESKTRIIETLEEIEDIFKNGTQIFIGINLTRNDEYLIYGDASGVIDPMKKYMEFNKDVLIVVCIKSNRVVENIEYWTSID